MEIAKRNTKYGFLSLAFHWLTFLLMVAVYFTIEIREIISEEESFPDTWILLHFLFGLLILVVFVPRLINFFKADAPAIEPPHSRLQNALAGFMHFALYVMMIGMPLSGWLMLGAKGRAVSFLGIELPVLVGENKSLAWVFDELHEIGGTVGYFLIGLHVSAALLYHYLIKDNTLRRMLPWGN